MVKGRTLSSTSGISSLSLLQRQEEQARGGPLIPSGVLPQQSVRQGAVQWGRLKHVKPAIALLPLLLLCLILRQGHQLDSGVRRVAWEVVIQQEERERVRVRVV